MCNAKGHIIENYSIQKVLVLTNSVALTISGLGIYKFPRT